MSDNPWPSRKPLVPGLIGSVLLALIVIGPTPAPAQNATAVSVTDVSQRAWSLATDGRMGELFDQITAISADQSNLAALKEQVRTYRENQKERRERRREAFDEALSELDEHLANDELAKALTSAVEAHGLSEHPDEFLMGAQVRPLIERAEAEAAKAEKEGRWFESIILYRRLDLLYDDQETYKADLQRVSRHLRLLRMYAPDAYYKQADAFARSQGDEPGERWEGDEEEGWKKDLEGIDSQMLVQALTRASDRHVENTRLDKLFIGGIDALRVMIRNKDLAATFPNLRDQDKVDAFEKRLTELRRKVDGRFKLMGYGDVSSRFNTLLDHNRATVNLPDNVIVHEFGDGAMNQLDDFSSIIWPKEMEQFQRTTKQEFSGVGIQITLTDEELTVVSPLEGTPAHGAGLKAGDRIVTIDGKSTVGISLRQAVDAITGPEDTEVTLGIRSPGREKVREVTLTRKKIKIHSVKGFGRHPGGLWDHWIDSDSRIGYARITQFGPDTIKELDEAVAQMRYDRAARVLAEAGIEASQIVRIVSAHDLDAGHPGVGAKLGREKRQQVERLLHSPRPINGLVLDLRFNPGGLLKAAVEVSDRFIDSGVIVSGHAGGGGDDQWAAEADKKDTYDDFPVVVLVNQGSASASEIVSGCLQDHDRALILGENSYGKGSVQQLFPLKFNKAFVKITTQYYKLPSGRIIHRRPGADAWGVKPDVQVRMTDMQVEKLIRARMVIDVLREEDEQVDAATVVGSGGDDDEAAQDRTDDADRPLPESAHEVLERGYDPQLETAVLLLKARLLGDLASG